jgi:hypothetical protein
VRRVQIVVWFLGQDLPRYFPVPKDEGWRFDTNHRELVIGKGMGRTHVPLDNVAYYSPEEYHAE